MLKKRQGTDKALRGYTAVVPHRLFNHVKTSFNLDDETVDRLIEIGGRLLRESP